MVAREDAGVDNPEPCRSPMPGEEEPGAKGDRCGQDQSWVRRTLLQNGTVATGGGRVGI
jgi:hypothetical protein